ncbi:MAG: S-adenosylmethionine:tRNA ribosyltransferase-isomerase [Rikenellaceae bacterium]
MKNFIDINTFNYPLADNRIAKYPLEQRSDSKLLSFKGGEIEDRKFSEIREVLPSDALLVFNQTKVVRARLVMHKATGARIEIFCLEPNSPADYERAFTATGKSSWHCMVGNAKKFNTPLLSDDQTFRAVKGEGDIVHFEWTTSETFGEVLTRLGNIPIPPYLNRGSEEIDTTRYQTAYAEVEGSVAAPTAGLHFSDEILSRIENKTFVTLHVGAGTFLPVKAENAVEHVMHTETFDVTIEAVEKLAKSEGKIVAVGTTSLRTIESLAVMGGRILSGGSPKEPVGQWERYEKHSIVPLLEYMREHDMPRLVGATQIMITPEYKFSTIQGIVTNFHQPKSTLLMLISAIVGDEWQRIYTHALENDYRFLSYGDSSYLELKEASENLP